MCYDFAKGTFASDERASVNGGWKEKESINFWLADGTGYANILLQLRLQQAISERRS
jgi:hypothetical protein